MPLAGVVGLIGGGGGRLTAARPTLTGHPHKATSQAQAVVKALVLAPLSMSGVRQSPGLVQDSWAVLTLFLRTIFG